MPCFSLRRSLALEKATGTAIRSREGIGVEYHVIVMSVFVVASSYGFDGFFPGHVRQV